MAFSSSVSPSGAASTSPSLCVSVSGVLGSGDREGSEGAVTVSEGPLPDGAASEVGLGADGSEETEKSSTSTFFHFYEIPQLLPLAMRDADFVTCSKTEIKTHQATGDYELYQLSNRTNNQ